jgi:hypothetical protein
MPLFNVAVREHAYTGRFYTDVVQAGSCEEALRVAAEHAAVSEPPLGPPPRQGFNVVVREQAYAGRVYSDVVQARSCQQALHVAAAQATAPEPAPDPTLSAADADQPGCADVWVYALLHCELEAGHDPPHMAVAHGYGRPVKWERNDLGIAHDVPDPAAGAPSDSPITPPLPAPQTEPPESGRRAW